MEFIKELKNKVIPLTIYANLYPYNNFCEAIAIWIINLKLGSDEDVMPKHENALACRRGELMGRKHSRFDAYFTALVSGTVE